ncbi:hypothetical protein LTR86_002533 [Recurvomyces mirabilis]|nr:hypothetical protein LTR86_002533 [Recurvomyces mirabilis]
MASGTASSALPPDVKNIEVADDGDVVLSFQCGSTIRASSVILSMASPVFKKMLGPKFLEGQATRSSEQPKTIELLDDDFDAMGMLLALMHFQQPAAPNVTAIELCRLAVAADKWDCVEPMSLATEALLRRKAVELSSSAMVDVSNELGAVASAAYLLRHREMFALFTRWLVLLETKPISTMMYREEFVNLPPGVILGLEEQRSAARDMLVNALGQRSNGRCIVSACTSRAASSSLTMTLLVYLKCTVWPPLWPDTPLRNILRKINSLPSIEIGEEHACRHHNPASIIPAEFQAMCKGVSDRVYGICLQCAREDSSQGKCEHVAEMKELVRRDPFVES